MASAESSGRRTIRMNIVDKSKEIVKYICENFEEWDLDDPIEEGYIDDYEAVIGVTEEELKSFEEAFEVELPESFKELYRYKNGSDYMCALPCVIGERDMTFCLMSLEWITSIKEYFQNKDALLTDYPDFFSAQDIERLSDSRIKPYLFNKRWFPFAEYCDSCYLMLDMNPGDDGKVGQIICYIHDPDEVVYVAPSLEELVSEVYDETVS